LKIENQIKDFISSEIIDDDGNLELDNTTMLIDSGIIDSMGIMKLLTYLEDTFSITIDGDELVPENFETIDAICSLVDKAASMN